MLRVGSVCEQDREKGLAHFCEHLAFRASNEDFRERYQVGEAYGCVSECMCVCSVCMYACVCVGVV